VYPSESVEGGYLAANGRHKVFRYREQAYSAANRLTIDGYRTHVVRSYKTDGYLVAVRGKDEA